MATPTATAAPAGPPRAGAGPDTSPESRTYDAPPAPGLARPAQDPAAPAGPRRGAPHVEAHDLDAGSSAVPPRRLGARARTWRAGAAGAVIAALLYGSAWGTDDHFPVGPMVQYAFSVPPAGEIRSHWLEADTADGTHIVLSTNAAGTGLNRAEMEGQIGRFIRDPSLLQGIADAHRRRHPDQPGYRRLYVVVSVTKLDHGRPASRYIVNRVTWDVR